MTLDFIYFVGLGRTQVDTMVGFEDLMGIESIGAFRWSCGMSLR